MSIRLRRFCRAAASVALAAAVSSFAGAKPPDLPTASREAVAPLAGIQPVEVSASRPAKIGQLIILGNERTSDDIIRAALPLSPGQVLSYPRVRQAERNLEKLGLFVVDPHRGIRPTVTVLENADSEYKDILVQVQEAATAPDDEELLYGTLKRDGCINQPNFVLHVKRVQGKKLQGVLFLRRAATGSGFDLVARAHEADLRIDREQKKLLVHVHHCTIISGDRDGAVGHVTDKTWPVELPTNATPEAATEAGEEEATAPPPPSSLGNADIHQAAARRMYLIGERCRHKGDLDMASNCYQETHLISPSSTYGRKAIARLHEIETGRGAETEEQETPQRTPKPDDDGLDEGTESQRSQLLIEPQESAAAPGAGEEQEVPAAATPPTLLIPRPPKNLTIHVDEPESYGATSGLLRQAGDVLQAATGLDIDLEIGTARSGAGLRAQGSILLGTVGYKLIYDDHDGHSTLVVVPSKP